MSDYAEVNQILRDERNRTTRFTATNSGGTDYPWGTIRHTEELVHTASDNHSEKALRL